jgi:hypothetical protein
MERFGIKLDSQSALSDGLYKLIMTDTSYDTGYVALARRKDTKHAGRFWGGVLDKQFKNLINQTSSDGATLPAALIVPSGEADAVIAESVKRGVQPTAYQLFDGYVMIGYKRADSAILIKEEHTPEPEIVEEPTPDTGRAVPSPTPEEAPIEKPKKAGKAFKIDPKTLAAAAILGVSIASIPFAINKFNDQPSYEVAQVAPAVDVEEVEADELINGSEGDPDTLGLLAANAPLGRYDFKDLIEDGYLDDVAKNPYLPTMELRKLAAHDDPDVRAAVGSNPNTPADLVSRLSKDPVASVRAAAASNPKLTEEQIRKMTEDTDPTVRSALLDNPKLTTNILDMLEPDMTLANCADKERIFAGSCATPAMLKYNVNNPDPCIRNGIARNPRTERSSLQIMQSDPNPYVRQQAFENSAADPVELAKLFKKGWINDTDPIRIENRIAALQNPSLDSRIVEELLSLNPGLYGSAYRNYAKALAASKLSSRNAEKLYNYARPKGGMRGLAKDINDLPTNMRFIKQLKGEKDTDKNWRITLRKVANRLFRNNIYDPIASVETGLDETIPAKDRTPTLVQQGANKPTLAEQIGGDSEFFEDNPIFANLEDEVENFGEFFADTTTLKGDNAERADGILGTADSIVDDIMTRLAPAMDHAMENLPGEEDYVKSVAADNDILLYAFSPAQTNSGAQSGDTAPAIYNIVDDDTYRKSCSKLEELDILLN